MVARILILSALLMCAVAAAPALAGAQAHPEPASRSDTPDMPSSRFGNPTAIARVYQDYIYGVVKKIDGKKKQLILDKTLFGDGQTFKLEPKTQFIHDGKRSSLKELKVGDEVYIKMHKDKKTGDMIAKKVVSGVLPTG